MTRSPSSSAPAPSFRVAVLTANVGSAGSRVVREAECLASSGHAVTVFCLAGQLSAAEETQARVRYVRLRDWHRAGPAAAAAVDPARPPNLIRKVKSAVAPFIQHALHAATFTQAIAALEPDIIHAHGFECLPAAVEAARRCGARVIYDIDEPEAGRLPDNGLLAARWKAHIERRALRHVAAAVAASPAIAASKARDFGIPLPAVIPNAPDASLGQRESDGWQRYAGHLIALYQAVGRGPRGLPAAMAQRALATSLPPRHALAVGN
jgi:hypothetical protein